MGGRMVSPAGFGPEAYQSRQNPTRGMEGGQFTAGSADHVTPQRQQQGDSEQEVLDDLLSKHPSRLSYYLNVSHITIHFMSLFIRYSNLCVGFFVGDGTLLLPLGDPVFDLTLAEVHDKNMFDQHLGLMKEEEGAVGGQPQGSVDQETSSTTGSVGSQSKTSITKPSERTTKTEPKESPSQSASNQLKFGGANEKTRGMLFCFSAIWTCFIIIIIPASIVDHF